MSYPVTLKFAGASLALMLAACGGGGGSGPATQAAEGTVAAQSTDARPAQSPPVASTESRSDLDIAALIFGGHERTPAGFYVEVDADANKVVATTHLKNRDVLDAGAPVRFEMCSDDWTQALEWSELAAARTGQHTDLVETNSNERFHEFVRVNFASVDAPLVRHRVFRCSYVDRADVDLDSLSGPGGRLSQTPVQSATVRELSEYLWQFSYFNNVGNAVLSSTTSESVATVSHELRMATLVRGGVSATCDRIDVVNWTRTADRESGVITRTFHTLRQFGARETAGSVELCAS